MNEQNNVQEIRGNHDASGLKKIFHIQAKNENQFSDNADNFYLI